MADRFTVFVRDDARCKAVKPPARLVLYALASRCDHNGYCWPSIEQIVEDTGLNRATVYRAMEQIREVLTVDAPGYKHSNSYIFPYQKRLSTAQPSSRGGGEGAQGRGDGGGARGGDGGGEQVVNNVDKLSQSATTVAECDGGGSQSATKGVAECDGGCRRVRPEVDREEQQEDSLSLSPSQTAASSQDDVDNYDGTRAPRNKNEMMMIRRWCWEHYLDKAHADEFVRINRLAHWKKVDATTSVKDLIFDFACNWRSHDAEGYMRYWRERNGRS